jgi:hypothetical protein
MKPTHEIKKTHKNKGTSEQVLDAREQAENKQDQLLSQVGS